MGEKVIELVHLQKQFGDHTVLRDIHLSVEKGEVLSIIGASGSGKSTMLRCINLLETPTSGQVLYHGQDITAREMNLSQYRAKVGMVFQSFNLFNNMTALQNCVTGQMSVLRRSSPADRSSAWRSPARLRWSRRCCSSTSRRARSIRRWSARCSMLCALSPETDSR